MEPSSNEEERQVVMEQPTEASSSDEKASLGGVPSANEEGPSMVNVDKPVLVSEGETSEESSIEPSVNEGDYKAGEKVELGVPVHEPTPQQRNSPRFLGWLQTLALFRKNVLTKVRSPLPTFFELFSPVLMMLILVAAYTLSDIEYRDARTYSDIEVDIPGPWLGLITQTSEFAGSSLTDSLNFNRRKLVKEQMPSNPMTDPIKINFMNGWEYDEGGDGEELDVFEHTLRQLQGLAASESNNDDEVAENITATFERQYRDVFDLLNDARGQLSQVLKSPIAVPNFRTYVSLSLALSSIIDSQDLPRILSDSSFGREWGNVLTLGTLHMSPNNAMANEFLSYLKQKYPILMAGLLQVHVHESEQDALKYINNNLEERTWALLDFNEMVEEDMRYKIRMNYTTLPNTNQITDYVSIGLNTQYQRYYLSGYLTLQRTLNAFSFWRMENLVQDEQCSAAQDDDLGLWSMPMPTAAYSQNSFFQAVGYLLGLTIAMAFLYPVSRFIKSLVEEKETRMKETLFILGVRGWAHWLSWVLTSLVVFCIITILVTVTLSSNVLKHSSPAYLFAFVGLFSSSTIGFSFFIAAFFSRAKLAAIIGPVALFATLLPRFIFFGSNRYEATTGKRAASLLPCTAFAFGADIIADYEYAEQGIQSYNASEGEYSFNTALGFLFFDTILYMFLGWYLELIIPRQYGVARKWYFILSPRYWCGVWKKCFSKRRGGKHGDDGSSVDMSDWSEDGSVTDFERVSDPAAVPRVRIHDLVKRYNKKKNTKPAVDNLNLTMYESQITCLLGHNGAGKTTTISVLTGLYPPTSGDCTIYGNSVVHDLIQARESMGICPQHNVLFESLTVLEHLQLFERIKGVRPTKTGVKDRAREIGLGEFFHTTASALSGGNQRKLSVAIALCGDPQFLILDEPTSGMDPASRRACWQLLRQKRAGRVTLLTTHFMDEAELLADRIAVMKEGKLQCCGSSLFLKNRFGLGYNLTVVLNTVSQATSAEEQMESGQQVAKSLATSLPDSNASERITNFLKGLIPDTVLVRRSARELTYRFPQGTEEEFPSVFDALEEQRDSLGIGAYGITNTTLEEVFLQLAEEQADSKSKGIIGLEVTGPKSPTSAAEASETEGAFVGDMTDESVVDTAEPFSADGSTAEPTQEPSTMETEPMGAFRQVGLLYYKRLVVQKRDWKGFFFMVVLPVILIALVLLILTIEIVVAGPAIDVSMDLYRKSPSGTQARTDVLVGGGASMSPAARRNDGVKTFYSRLSSTLGEEYTHADFMLEEELTTSADMSQYLLETINNRSHDARYGALVFDDSINVNLAVDWDTIRNDIKALGSLSIGVDEQIDFLQLLGPLGVGDERPVRLNISVAELAELLFDATTLTEESAINSTLLSELTKTALTDMLLASKDPARAAEWYADVSNAVFNLADILRELQSATGFNATELNTTELLNAASDFVNDITEVITKSLTENFNTTDPASILNAFLNGEANTTDLLDFLESVGVVFEDDINLNSTNLTALVEAISENVTLTLDAILASDDFFTREAVAKAHVDIFNGVFSMLDLSMALNVTWAVDSVLGILDEAVNSYNGNFSSFPNTLLTIPIIVADSFLQEFNESFGEVTVTLGDALGELSKLVGGDAELLDGYVQLLISEASVDFSTMSITVTDLSVVTESQELFSISGALSLSTITDRLWSLFPKGSSDYNFDVGTTASILHNATSPHAVAAFNQAYMDYLYKRCSSNTHARLSSVNHPLPLTTQQSLEIKTILSVLASLFILIPLCYILGAFIVFPVKERVSKSKHLQLVSGVNMSAYWTATYLWDLTLFAVLTILIMIVFLIYGKQSAEVFVGSVESFFATMALIFGYGMSALPFSYLLSRLFDNPSSSQIAVMGIFFITGFVAVNAYFIMSSIDNTKDVAESLRPLFRMWPAYNVGEGLIQLSSAFLQRELLGEEKHPFDWDVAGKSIALLYLLSMPYSVWLLLLEYSADGGSGGLVGRMLRSLRASWEGLIMKSHGLRKSESGALLLDDGLDDLTRFHESEDEDVIEERAYVMKNKNDLETSASVLMVNLWKVYPPSVGLLGSVFAALRGALAYVVCCRCFRRGDQSDSEDGDENQNSPKRAVRGLTAAIHDGETFGLLGQNGGGKSTTLNVLTGDISATAGEAYVAGHDVTGSVPGGVANARKNIGFCPQVDPLLDLMTGRETLTMFARLRGISKEHLDSTVNQMLDRLTLAPHADKTSESYSGGNKRKLSLGIALIGDPRVLFIDEASSGMDPAARRHMWSLIEEVSQRRSVILTTHSMEEAEALCTRIGIMVHGKLLCLGSVQHLKTTYLDGYTIDVHCVRGTPDHIVDRVEQEILNEALPGSRLSERHGTMMRFDVSSLSALGLGTTFRRLQELKQNPEFRVDDYSISQCSLEQVFISLVGTNDRPATSAGANASEESP